jgi:hypothetical protein
MEVLGPLALIVGFFVAGEALLVGLGLVRSAGGVVASAGMATFSGWAVTALGLSLALVLGAAPTFRNALVVWVLACVAAIVWRLLRWDGPVLPRALRERRLPGRAIAAAGAIVLAGYLVALLVRAWEPTGVLHPDVWIQWLPKAKILYFFGDLDTGPGGWTSLLNPDYPPLHPASEALVFDVLGGADTLDLARLHWAIDASFVLAVAWLLAPRVRPAILWPCLAMLALAPGFGVLLGSSLADEPLSLLVALAGITAALWLLEGDDRFALLCGLFLGAATLTKNEGLMLSLVIVVALAVTRVGRRRIGVVAALAAVPLAVHGVWRIWLARHSVPPNPFYELADVFRPGYLLDRVDRLWYGLRRLVDELLSPSRWLLLVPATTVLAVLAARRSRPVATFVLTVVVLDVVGFATIYWLSRVDLHFYVDNTVDRLPAFIALFCGALLPLLLSEAAVARPGARPARRGLRR